MFVHESQRTEPMIHIVGDARLKKSSTNYGNGDFWPDKYVCKCGSDKFYVGGDEGQYSTSVECVECGRLAEVHSG